MSEPLSFSIGVPIGPVSATRITLDPDDDKRVVVKLVEQGGRAEEVGFNLAKKTFEKRLGFERIEDDPKHVRAAKARAMAKTCDRLVEAIARGRANASRAKAEEAKAKDKRALARKAKAEKRAATK